MSKIAIGKPAHHQERAGNLIDKKDALRRPGIDKQVDNPENGEYNARFLRGRFGEFFLEVR